MDKFKNFSKEERQAIIFGLLKECNNYVEYGFNGLTEKGKKMYNITLSLLKEADINKEYEYIYRDFKYA